MYANAAAVGRPEISTFLEEAQDVEKNLFAEKVLPVWTSENNTGRYPRLRVDLGRLLHRESTLRAPKATYNEIERTHEWDNFTCVERGLTELIDDSLASQQKNYFDTEIISARLLRRAMMIDYEVRVADLIMNPNTFNSTDASEPYTEAALDDVDIAKDIEDAQTRGQAKGINFNTLILSDHVMKRIRRSKKFQTFLFGANEGGRKMVRDSDIKDAFGFDMMYVSKQTYNAGLTGQASSMLPCWGNDYIALLDVQSGDFSNGGVGRTIVWGADSPGGLFVSESFRDEPRRGQVLRVRTHTCEKIVSSLCGELIHTGYTA